MSDTTKNSSPAISKEECLQQLQKTAIDMENAKRELLKVLLDESYRQSMMDGF